MTNEGSACLDEQVKLIRELQKKLHELPLESPEMQQLIGLCHKVAGRLTGQLLLRDVLARLPNPPGPPDLSPKKNPRSPKA